MYMNCLLHAPCNDGVAVSSTTTGRLKLALRGSCTACSKQHLIFPLVYQDADVQFCRACSTAQHTCSEESAWPSISVSQSSELVVGRYLK